MTITLLLSLLLACGGQSSDATTKKADKAEKTAEAAPAATDVPAPADVAAPPADAVKTASGLAYKVLTPGNGTEKPQRQDSVELNYTGWTTDGKMIDSTTKRKKPTKVKVKAGMPGWTEGLQLMSVGEKTRFWIPAELAWQNKPGKPAGMLVYDMELVKIHPGPVPIPAPEDVAAPPADAKKTASGLSYKVLTPGTGKEHPKADQLVEVDYTGWTKDGEMFDSSVARGRPATFNLGRVIKGWTEGVQLMTVGEKTRFWIPADLAYGDTAKRPGSPVGQLTFDIELKAIKDAPPAPAKRTTPLDPKALPHPMPEKKKAE